MERVLAVDRTAEPKAHSSTSSCLTKRAFFVVVVVVVAFFSFLLPTLSVSNLCVA